MIGSGSNACSSFWFQLSLPHSSFLGEEVVQGIIWLKHVINEPIEMDLRGRERKNNSEMALREGEKERRILCNKCDCMPHSNWVHNGNDYKLHKVKVMHSLPCKGSGWVHLLQVIYSMSHLYALDIVYAHGIQTFKNYIFRQWTKNHDSRLWN